MSSLRHSGDGSGTLSERRDEDGSPGGVGKPILGDGDDLMLEEDGARWWPGVGCSMEDMPRMDEPGKAAPW